MTEHERFESLVRPLLDRLLSFARRRVGNPADAEDVVQETVIRAWRGMSSLRDPDAAAAWLFTILRTTISDHHARQGRRHALIEFTELSEEHVERIGASEPGLLEQLIRDLSGERLREALSRMPEDFAGAVELHDLHGFRYREIAEITQVPIGSVMSRIHRGRKLLAEILLREYGGADLSSLQPAP